MSVKYRLRTAANVVLEKLNVPKIPPRIPLYFIEVTNTCNLNCDFCPRNDLSRGTGFMEFNLFKLVIERIKETGTRYVNLNRFGESLTHPQFMDMLRYAKNQEINNIGLVTNGQLLTTDVVEQIVDADIDRVNISLDTLDKTKYENTRKGARLEKTLKGIDYLIQYRNKVGTKSPKIGIFSVLVTDDFEQMQRVFQTYKDRADFVEFRPIAQYGSSQRLKELPHIKTTKVNIMTCIQPWQRLNIYYNGDVNPCCGDVDGELVLGNIKDYSIKELWYGKEINRIRKLLTKKVLDALPVCLSCDGSDEDFRRNALRQAREVYRKLDPDIHVTGMSASTPVVIRRSTNEPWRQMY